jgi:small subunit ribosomal protein S12e
MMVLHEVYEVLNFLLIISKKNLFIFIFIESVKALDRREAHLCVLASNCDEPNYVKLIEALCAEHNINLLRVDDNKKLGEWAGLCKLDKDGKARKVVRCSCCVVRDFGDETQAHDQLLEYMKKTKQSA